MNTPQLPSREAFAQWIAEHPLADKPITDEHLYPYVAVVPPVRWKKVKDPETGETYSTRVMPDKAVVRANAQRAVDRNRPALMATEQARRDAGWDGTAQAALWYLEESRTLKATRERAEQIRQFCLTDPRPQQDRILLTRLMAQAVTLDTIADFKPTKEDPSEEQTHQPL